MESEKLALITRYFDNHCPVTRYPDAQFNQFNQFTTHNHRESIIENPVSSIQNRESSYLRAYKAHLHLSRTLYKSATFMQNKPNFRKSQMNVNICTREDYENEPR